MIIGSRSIESFDLTQYVPLESDLIISGGAGGIDSIAEQYADRHKISKLILRPRYDLYRRVAPLRRNRDMVDTADELLAIWDGKSQGTLYTVEYAKKSNKKVTVINISDRAK